jgi:hypothetical protein
MKQTSRSARDVGGLLAAICALAIITVTLGALAVRAENPVPAQTPSAAQTPAPARSATSTPTPSPTPTPINWSTDPMLKAMCFAVSGRRAWAGA